MTGNNNLGSKKIADSTGWQTLSIPQAPFKILSQGNTIALLEPKGDREIAIFQCDDENHKQLVKLLSGIDVNSASNKDQNWHEILNKLFKDFQSIPDKLTVDIPGVTVSPVPVSIFLSATPEPSLVDFNTNLPNRRVLASQEKLDTFLEGLEGPFQFAFLDFVGMGATNSFGLGTPFTDVLLKEFGGVVDSVAKVFQAASVKALRYGGDEFVLVGSGLKPKEWNEFLTELSEAWLTKRSEVINGFNEGQRANLNRAETLVLAKKALRAASNPLEVNLDEINAPHELSGYSINSFRWGTSSTSGNGKSLQSILDAVHRAESEMLRRKGEKQGVIFEHFSDILEKLTRLFQNLNKVEENNAKNPPPKNLYTTRDILDTQLGQLGLGDGQYQLVQFDIPNFGIYNNAFGHDAGDKLLEYFTGLLMDVAPNSLILHSGGGQFRVLLDKSYAWDSLRERFHSWYLMADLAKKEFKSGEDKFVQELTNRNILNTRYVDTKTLDSNNEEQQLLSVKPSRDSKRLTATMTVREMLITFERRQDNRLDTA